jgi:MFS family permease
MIVMIGWGRISDRVGRKPVLVFSLCGEAIASAIFGLAQEVWQMILFRCIAGMFAGSIVSACSPFF